MPSEVPGRPAEYVPLQEPAVATETPKGTDYTCPMHPEILRHGPGSCPICGMAFEPRTNAIDEENLELLDMTRRFWVSAVLTLPMLVFMLSEMLPGKPLQKVLGQLRPHGYNLSLQLPSSCGEDGWVRRGGRMSLIAELEVEGAPQGFTAVSTHLEDRGRSACRADQVDTLLSQLRNTPGAVVIGGDLNTSGKTAPRPRFDRKSRSELSVHDSGQVRVSAG